MKKILLLTLTLCVFSFTPKTFAQVDEVPDEDIPSLHEIFADSLMRSALLNATLYKEEPSLAPRLYRTQTINLKDHKVTFGPWTPNRSVAQRWAYEKNENKNFISAVKDSLVLTDGQLVLKVLRNMIAREQKIDTQLDAEDPAISFSRDTFWTKFLWVQITPDNTISFQKTGWLGEKNVWFKSGLLQVNAEWSLVQGVAKIQAVDNTHKFMFTFVEGNLVSESEVFLPPTYRQVFESALNVLEKQE